MYLGALPLRSSFVGDKKSFEVDSLFNGKPMKSYKERSNMIKLSRYM